MTKKFETYWTLNSYVNQLKITNYSHSWIQQMGLTKNVYRKNL